MNPNERYHVTIETPGEKLGVQGPYFTEAEAWERFERHPLTADQIGTVCRFVTTSRAIGSVRGPTGRLARPLTEAES